VTVNWLLILVFVRICGCVFKKLCNGSSWIVHSFQDDLLRLDFSNVMQEAVARLEEIKKSIEAKMALRQSNLNPERPG